VSGKKLFKRVVASANQTSAVIALGNGDLRSLSLHLRDTKLGTEIGDHVMALCMGELMVRFMGKKSNLL
jgi:hypothetical protein